MLASGIVHAEDMGTAATPPSDLTYQIKGSESFSYDSNPLLLLHGAPPLFGSITAPELVVTSNRPDSNISADTIIDGNVFNQSNFDSVDFHEIAGLNETTGRWSAGMQGTVDYDTTRTSELTNYGLDLPNVRHLGISALPQIGYHFTLDDDISVQSVISGSRYDNRAFTDYNLFSITPAYGHKFDELDIGTVSMQAQRYETVEGVENYVDSIGPSIGWIRLLTPRLTAKLSIGIQTTSQYGQPGTGPLSTFDYVFSNDITFKGIEDTADLVASRSQYPFSNGTDGLLTALTFSESHALNETFSINGGASYQTVNYQGNPGIALNTGISGNAGITYHALDTLDVEMNYQYKQESLTNENGNIQEQIVLLSLIFHPAAKAL